MRRSVQNKFSVAVRRMFAHRYSRRGGNTRAHANPRGTDADRQRGPSTMAMRRELESFRLAQGAPYWHHDPRAR
jgi:hypothetical protein